jgi:L-rhamnose mutarotase
MAFTARLKPAARARYLALHADPPAPVLAALRAGHVRDYRIFVTDDDRLFAVFTYVGDDFDADMARIGGDPASVEWHHVTAQCQIVPPGAEDGWTPLPPIFALD